MNRKERRANKGKNKENGKANGGLNLAPGMQVSQTPEGKTKVSIPVPQAARTNIKDRDQYLKDFKKARKLVDEDKLAEATQILSNLLKQHPRDHGVIELLALASENLKNYDAALKFYKAARELQPDRHVLDVCISNLLIRTDKIEEGIALGENVIEKHSDALKPSEQAAIHGMVGNAYMILGDKEKAKPLLKAACEIEPDNIEFLYNHVTQTGKPKDHDDIFLQRLLDIDSKNSLENEKDRFLLKFSLFDCFDTLKEHEKALDYAIEGAKIKRETLTYDGQVMQQIMDGIRNYFIADFFEEIQYKSHPSETPVFIIGMPRSGTTLLEQILQAHPDISGVGEDALIGHLIKYYSFLNAYQGAPYPLRFSSDKHGFFKPHEIGQKYAEYLEKLHPTSKRVINKAIGNMLYVGFLSKALPNCKFIHIKRNAMDSCLSAFTKNFSDESQSYSYDMQELGGYYKNYVELMDHWNTILPGKILNIEYEQIVDNLEEKSKEVIDFLNLPWNDACLEFYKIDSVVRTASVSQVRKPIYKSAMNRWKRYGPKIAPLIKALDHAAPPEAQEYLKTLEEKAG